MTRLIVVTTCLLMLASSVRAEDDWAKGLHPVEIQGQFAADGYLRPQEIDRPSRAPTIIGASLAIGGGVGLVAAWALYVARQNYRLEPRLALTRDNLDTWESIGNWSLGFAAGSAGALITSEYMLLGESRGVPTLAWIGGLAGLVTAAVGVGYAVGGTHCAPIAVGPGTMYPKACGSGTADALFGHLLGFTAAPLVNLPLVYLLRDAFGGAPASLTWNGGPGLEVKGSF